MLNFFVGHIMLYSQDVVWRLVSTTRHLPQIAGEYGRKKTGLWAGFFAVQQGGQYSADTKFFLDVLKHVEQALDSREDVMGDTLLDFSQGYCFPVLTQ